MAYLFLTLIARRTTHGYRNQTDDRFLPLSAIYTCRVVAQNIPKQASQFVFDNIISI